MALEMARMRVKFSLLYNSALVARIGGGNAGCKAREGGLSFFAPVAVCLYSKWDKIKFDGLINHAISRTILITLEYLKVERSRCFQIAKRVHVKHGTNRTNITTTQTTALINVGSINYEHAWYIAKVEEIVSVIVTAVDTVSLSVL